MKRTTKNSLVLKLALHSRKKLYLPNDLKVRVLSIQPDSVLHLVYLCMCQKMSQIVAYVTVIYGTQTDIVWLDAVMSWVKRTLLTYILWCPQRQVLNFSQICILLLYIDATLNREKDKQIVPSVLFFRRHLSIMIWFISRLVKVAG